MKKNTTVSTKREQGTSKRTKKDIDAKAPGLKVRTNLKAGAGSNPGHDPDGRLAANHNETLAR